MFKNSNPTTTAAERAAEHIAKASKLVKGAENVAKPDVAIAQGTAAGAHATLALYWQREAERVGA